MHSFCRFCILDNSGSRIDVEKYFSQLLSEDKSLSAGIAAIKTLLMVLEKTKCTYGVEWAIIWYAVEFHHTDF